MKRREFNAGLIAASAAPGLPLPKATTAAPVAAAANFTAFMYASGAQFARLNGSCSPAMLSERFGLPAEVAGAINARLIKNGILTAPNALGVCQSTDKYAPKPGLQESFDSTNSQPATEETKQTLRMGDDDSEPEQDLTDVPPHEEIGELDADNPPSDTDQQPAELA